MERDQPAPACSQRNGGRVARALARGGRESAVRHRHPLIRLSCGADVCAQVSRRNGWLGPRGWCASEAIAELSFKSQALAALVAVDSSVRLAAMAAVVRWRAPGDAWSGRSCELPLSRVRCLLSRVVADAGERG